MTRVSVIVPAHESEELLPRAIAGVLEQRLDERYEVVVVDDGSRDRTAELGRQALGAAGRLVSQPRTGPAGARNAGVAAAAGELLAFVDADCVPRPGWLAAGVAALRDADLAQGAVVPDPHTPIGPFDRTISVQREHGLYETASLFVRRALFDAIGGFEAFVGADVPRGFGEDVWFGWRARRAGARTLFCQEAVVEHAVLPGGPLDSLRERRRLLYFTVLARLVPELRREFFYRGIFLSRRTAEFDLALLGALAAWRARSPLPLLAAAPYARRLAGEVLALGRRGPSAGAVSLAGDLVGALSLLEGSIRNRAPLF